MLAVARIEDSLVLQEGRHQEVEDGPQLGNSVLKRRTRQHELALSSQRLHGLGELRFGRLDAMALVEHHIEEVDAAEAHAVLLLTSHYVRSRPLIRHNEHIDAV